MQEFICPHCHSENIQSCPIIYQSGTSGTASMTTADRFIAVTKGKTMTDLARSVAPPTQRDEGWGVVYFFGVVTGLIFTFEGVSLISVISAVVLLYFLKQSTDVQEYNKKVFPELYNTWLHSYLCHRCGNVFVIW